MLGCLTLAGCEKQYPNEKPVFPITGVVKIDGVPQEGIQVVFHDERGVDVKQPTFPTAFTDAQGNLIVSTYANGDGAPAGNYLLTFIWGQINPLSMSYGGPDKLQGRYADAEKSEFRLVVGEDVKNDLGVIDLSTQPKSR